MLKNFTLGRKPKAGGQDPSEPKPMKRKVVKVQRSELQRWATVKPARMNSNDRIVQNLGMGKGSRENSAYKDRSKRFGSCMPKWGGI